MVDQIQIKIANGSEIPVPKGISVNEFIKKAFSGEAKKVYAVLFNGDVKDIREFLEVDGEVEFITEEHPQVLDVLRHSGSHILAQAVLQLFPEAKLGIGPSTTDGFYYDFLVPKPFEPSDLVEIEKTMLRLVKKNMTFERQEMSSEEAIRFFESRGEVFKVELIRDLNVDHVTIFKQGDFVDLCRGPHVWHTGQIKVVKLLSIAAAYWRGDESRPVLQRIYGTAFLSQEDLDKFLEMREKIKQRDHRKLGKELDFYSVHEDVGAGLIFWHPKLAMVRHLIENFWREEHLHRGYGFVYTPHIARERIYETSGHLQNYSENMYSALLIDEQPYRLKPMNCPGHIKIYQTRLRSYRDLPIRYCELGTVYRYERSGTLHGMLRVRGFTQDDAHVFCTPRQIADEVYQILDLVDTLMRAFGYTYKIFLATRPEKYLGSDEEWEWSTNALREALDRWGQSYEIDAGGGVFYAPKIDIKLTDALGREWQGPTIQVDLNLPKRFGVSYIGEDNQEHEVIMIHRAVLGSMERFVGGLIEHVGGAFPVWIAPVQIIVMPITSAQEPYGRAVFQRLNQEGFRVELDNRNEKIGFKIREAQQQKIPYMLVLGGKEAEQGNLSVRHRKQGDLGVMPLDQFIDAVRREISAKIIDES